jgi:hypothetical protein
MYVRILWDLLIFVVEVSLIILWLLQNVDKYCWVLGNWVPEIGPWPLLKQPHADQVSAEQSCEAEQPTSPGRRSDRPSPYRVTRRGGAIDQVPASKPATDQAPVEQPSETKVSI